MNKVNEVEENILKERLYSRMKYDNLEKDGPELEKKFGKHVEQLMKEWRNGKSPNEISKTIMKINLSVEDKISLAMNFGAQGMFEALLEKEKKKW